MTTSTPSHTDSQVKTENWKKVKGFSNCIEVSDLGSVRSIHRIVKTSKGTRISKSQLLRPYNKKGGYSYLNTSFSGKHNTLLVHRIVAIAFLPNPKNKPCVNHKNGIKHDNRALNLEWVTYAENEQHSYRVLGKKSVPGNLGRTGINSFEAKPIAMYDLDGNFISYFGTATDAANHLSGDQANVSAVARGVRRVAYGHTFKFISKKKFFKETGIKTKFENVTYRHK